MLKEHFISTLSKVFTINLNPTRETESEYPKFKIGITTSTVKKLNFEIQKSAISK